MNTTLGVYCGSFNPFHKGHLNIAQKAAKIFTKVILAQGVNPEKIEKGLVPPALSPVICGFETIRYKTLTTTLIQEYIEEGAFNEIVLIRGLRSSYDYEHELNQLQYMKDVLPNLNVALIPCDRIFNHISSEAIRNLAPFEEKFTDIYLPV